MPGRDVGDAHGRVGLVHVLAARAGRAVGIDPQVLLVDLDLDLVGDHRPHVHLRERGVAARLGVERRDAHQAVDAALGAEEAVGVLALGDEGGGLEPRLLALGRLPHLDLEAAALGPAQVHAKEHLGPVLGVGPAGTRAHRHDGVARVVLTVEEAGLLELGKAPLDRGELRVELGRDLLVLGGHLEQVVEVADVGLERAEALEALLRAGVLRRGLRRGLLVIPEARRLHLPLEPGYLRVERSGVKGSPREGSAPRVPRRRARRSCVPVSARPWRQA